MEIVWRVGDRWRDLTPDLSRAGEATVLTNNGAVHLIDLRAGKQLRVSTAHPMPGDGKWRSLGSIQATPCGMHATTIDGAWHRSARVRLVVSGRDPELAETEAGQEALSTDWSAPGHGPWRCPTPHCAKAEPVDNHPT